MLAANPFELYSQIRPASPDVPEDVRPPEHQVEFRVRDPEGNEIDLSDAKGRKIDVDRWARVE